jgi:hypothetical protein
MKPTLSLAATTCQWRSMSASVYGLGGECGAYSRAQIARATSSM